MSKNAQVGVIMRTKDRAHLLERAFKSVFNQTFEDLVVVVVNDGGDKAPIDRLLKKHEELISNRVTVIHNPSPTGRWNAANQGIEAVNTQYIILHDDDDTWQENLLEEAVTFLGDDKNKDYGGVAVGTTVIDEIIDEAGKVTLLDRRRFRESTKHFSLYELCKNNLFPPISFLYKKSLHEKVGVYDNNLKVLGDWDFNLKVMQIYDVGYIDKPLANWHFRKSNESHDKNLNNVTTSNKFEYQESFTSILNTHLRRDLQNGKLGIGYLINDLHSHDIDTQSIISSIEMGAGQVKHHAEIQNNLLAEKINEIVRSESVATIPSRVVSGVKKRFQSKD